MAKKAIYTFGAQPTPEPGMTLDQALSAYLEAKETESAAHRDLCEARRKHRMAQGICGVRLDALRRATEVTSGAQGAP